jgi:hypothetical protein
VFAKSNAAIYHKNFSAIVKRIWKFFVCLNNGSVLKKICAAEKNRYFDIPATVWCNKPTHESNGQQ